MKYIGEFVAMGLICANRSYQVGMIKHTLWSRLLLRSCLMSLFCDGAEAAGRGLNRRLVLRWNRRFELEKKGAK